MNKFIVWKLDIGIRKYCINECFSTKEECKEYIKNKKSKKRFRSDKFKIERYSDE